MNIVVDKTIRMYFLTNEQYPVYGDTITFELTQQELSKLETAFKSLYGSGLILDTSKPVSSVKYLLDDILSRSGNKDFLN
jgi:hypothetical protein